MSDIIYTPPASSGGGGQNPTSLFIPVNNGTSNFVDSNIENDVNNTLATKDTGGTYFGFNISFSGYYTYLGDFNSTNNGTFIIVDDANQYFQTINQGNDVGLFLDFANRIYYLGDFSGYNNGTRLEIDEISDLIQTINIQGKQGISLDLGGKFYKFGDYNATGNQTHIAVKDSAKQISLFTNGGSIFFNTDGLTFQGALTSGSAGGNSGQHLQVTINGTPYKIALLNP